MDAEPVRRVVNASVERVGEVLSNGWLYASWVVGASRIRGVDKDWPKAGSSIAHSVGFWPLLLSDTTTSLVESLPHRLELRARAWPAGEGRVVITAEPADQSNRCLVCMAETATSGPARLVPGQIEQPLIRYRNVEALRRLAMLAENRSAGDAET